MKLDKEEKKILDAYEKGHIKTKFPSEEEIKEVKKIAETTFRKNKRITIRLYDHDYKGIQKKAMEKGMPYQTLISAMIHQYIEGDLVERKTG
jgi:predicted DNA binding CopG/RHH family protein